MANSLTNKGEEYALLGDGSSDGGIARLATTVNLYNGSTSTPAKDGTGFTEVSGGGYAAKSIVVGDWSFGLDGSNGQIVLADQTWTASGGSIANIGGAYLTDGSNVLAWWERSSLLTLADGDSLTLDDLTIRLTTV